MSWRAALLALVLLLTAAGCSGSSTDDAEQAAESEAVEESTSTTSTTTEPLPADPPETTTSTSTTTLPADCTEWTALIDRLGEAVEEYEADPSEPRREAALAALSAARDRYTDARLEGCSDLISGALWNELEAALTPTTTTSTTTSTTTTLPRLTARQVQQEVEANAARFWDQWGGERIVVTGKVESVGVDQWASDDRLLIELQYDWRIGGSGWITCEVALDAEEYALTLSKGQTVSLEGQVWELDYADDVLMRYCREAQQ